MDTKPVEKSITCYTAQKKNDDDIAILPAGFHNTDVMVFVSKTEFTLIGETENNFIFVKK